MNELFSVSNVPVRLLLLLCSPFHRATNDSIHLRWIPIEKSTMAQAPPSIWKIDKVNSVTFVLFFFSLCVSSSLVCVWIAAVTARHSVNSLILYYFLRCFFFSLALFYLQFFAPRETFDKKEHRSAQRTNIKTKMEFHLAFDTLSLSSTLSRFFSLLFAFRLCENNLSNLHDYHDSVKFHFCHTHLVVVALLSFPSPDAIWNVFDVCASAQNGVKRNELKWWNEKAKRTNKMGIAAGKSIRQRGDAWRCSLASKWNYIELERWYRVENNLLHARTYTHTHRFHFHFCNDADVIGVNLIRYLFFCASSISFSSFLLLIILAVSNIYKLLFYVLKESKKCMRDTFFSSFYMHSYAYLFAIVPHIFFPLNPPLSFFRSYADILVSMQILSKFAVNYVLRIFTSWRKKCEHFFHQFIHRAYCTVRRLAIVIPTQTRAHSRTHQKSLHFAILLRIAKRLLQKQTCVSALVETE